MANVVATESFYRALGSKVSLNFLNRLCYVARIPFGQSAGAGGVFAWQNPEPFVIFVVHVHGYISTVQAGQTVDIGRTTASNVSGDDIIDGRSIASGAEFDWIKDKGTNGRGVAFVLNKAGVGASWITATASGTPAALSGYCWIHYVLAEGL